MANKSMIGSNEITLIDRKNVVTDECDISETFNKHYINIVEKSCENKPNEIALHKKWSLPLRISLVNVTQSGVSRRFGHIYWRYP